MAARAPLTLAEKEWLYAEKLRGRSLSAIAAELNCSHETARKWWRIARDHGRVSFQRKETWSSRYRRVKPLRACCDLWRPHTQT